MKNSADLRSGGSASGFDHSDGTLQRPSSTPGTTLQQRIRAAMIKQAAKQRDSRRRATLDLRTPASLPTPTNTPKAGSFFRVAAAASRRRRELFPNTAPLGGASRAASPTGGNKGVNRVNPPINNPRQQAKSPRHASPVCTFLERTDRVVVQGTGQALRSKARQDET